MAGNSAFIIRQGRGWQRGLDNFLRAELTAWFGTRTWLTHLLIWVGMIDGILAVTLYSMQRAGDAGTPMELASTGVMIYCIFTGMFAGIGVVIIMQDAIVGERQTGTAAWVLSKPVSRAAFVLTKLFGNMAGILVMMVLIPGLIAYVLISQLALGEWLPFLNFLAAMVCLAVALIFYQTFVLMLGTLFTGRGAVIGLGLAFLFGQQFLAQTVPALFNVLPVGIFLNQSDVALSLTGALILGQPVPTFSPVLWSAALSILFVVISLWRFERVEF
jgi:ABC-2 type transport system permease protein